MLLSLAVVTVLAADCAVGSVTVDAPTCEVKAGPDTHPYFGKVTRASLEWLDPDGFNRRVYVLTPVKRRGLGGLLRSWRSNHGCSAVERTVAPSAKGAITWSGSCEGGDDYLMRVQLIGDSVLELHVDHLILADPRAPMPRGSLAEAFSRLAASVR